MYHTPARGYFVLWCEQSLCVRHCNKLECYHAPDCADQLVLSWAMELLWFILLLAIFINYIKIFMPKTSEALPFRMLDEFCASPECSAKPVPFILYVNIYTFSLLSGLSTFMCIFIAQTKLWTFAAGRAQASEEIATSIGVPQSTEASILCKLYTLLCFRVLYSAENCSPLDSGVN